MTDYCASKFAVFGFNEALRMELRHKAPNVNTLCVCPFYVNTGMFDGVQTKYPFILPILDANYVTDRIIEAIQRKDGVLILPPIVYLTYLARFEFFSK